MSYDTIVLWDKFNTEADVQKMLEHHGWRKVRERQDRIDYVRPGKGHNVS